MKKILLAIVCFMAIQGLYSAPQVRKTCIDKNWKFHYGHLSGAYTPDYDDSSWRSIDLPHDWSIEEEAAKTTGEHIGPFAKNNMGQSATGQTVGGEGWYRKTIILDKEDEQKRILLYFEGVYSQAEIWVNGLRTYFNPYGYSSFRFDITDYLKPAGEKNTIAVKASNEGKNTRWYAGSGIYRHVWLIKTPQVHLDERETVITTTLDATGKARISISADVFNESNLSENTELAISIIAPDGKTLAATDTLRTEIPAYEETNVSVNLDIDAAELWSPDTPSLYTACLTLTGRQYDGDHISIPFGIRTIEFSAEKGFLLNGKSLKLKGGCVHHDHGLLGAASYDKAEERKVRLLKEYGFNAVRCSHNIPAEHFLTACDRMGLLVIDEAFDQWMIAKNPQDYARYFKDYHERDLEIMIKRDRNHPCVIMWSIGNEIPGRADAEGMKIAEHMKEIIRRMDKDRPVTAAVNDFWDNRDYTWSKDAYRAFMHLDVCGYNYMWQEYENDHKRFPQRIVYGSESYPKQASQNWDLVEKHPYVIGDFVWTAMDYLGEAGIAHSLYLKPGEKNPQFMDWPWYNGWCGDIDLIGEKKPQSYYRDVIWRIRPITMAVEPPAPNGTIQAISGWGWQNEKTDWTFPGYTENDIMRVNVYTRSSGVRLYLNEELVGEKQTSDTYFAGFDIPYKPGILKAVEWDGSQEGEFFELRTTGKPTSIRLKPDRTKISANGKDLVYILIEMIDEKGQRIWNTNNKVQLSCSGNGTLIAAGNASPNDMESFRSSSPRLFNGQALAIIKSSEKAGEVSLNAYVEGIGTASVTLSVVEDENENPASIQKTNQNTEYFCVFSSGRQIHITGTDHYQIYNAAGQPIEHLSAFSPGLYLVKSGMLTKKVIVKP